LIVILLIYGLVALMVAWMQRCAGLCWLGLLGVSVWACLTAKPLGGWLAWTCVLTSMPVVQLWHTFMAAAQAGGHAQTNWRTWLQSWWVESWQALSVFAWRQPWRINAEPDHLPPDAPQRTGVILVHGYLCNRAFWGPWLRALRERGVPCVAVTLPSVFGSIDAHAPLIEDAVSRMVRQTGHKPWLVGHSMGGLAVRAWWRSWRVAALQRGEMPLPLSGRVQGVFTLAAPHKGTWLAKFSHAECGRQMRLGSAWLEMLAADEPASELAICQTWGTPNDAVVFPEPVTHWSGARHCTVEGVGHVSLAFHPAPIASLLQALEVSGK
jgi:hypothetical protein